MTAVVSHADAMDETPDPEVPERAKRPRSYSARYKAEILAEYERLDKAGKGALLRREGLYTSLISEWRKQRDRVRSRRWGRPRAGHRPILWSGRTPGCVAGSSSSRASWARPAR
jgi:transposase